MAKYLNLATRLAKENPIQKLPQMAAVLELTNKQLVFGYNQRRTHPLQARFGKNSQSIYLHAEIDAIRRALMLNYDIDGATLYVSRVLRSGITALAKPCIGCQRALVHFDIAECYWTE